MALRTALLQNLIIKLKKWHKTVKDDPQTQIFATKQMKISANINHEWDITGARECFLCRNQVKYMAQQCAGVVSKWQFCILGLSWFGMLANVFRTFKSAFEKTIFGIKS